MEIILMIFLHLFMIRPWLDLLLFNIVNVDSIPSSTVYVFC